MDEEFLNFLCKENWIHDADERYLNFKKDNTGEILARTGPLLFIWSTFEWNCTPITTFNLNATSEDDQTPRLMGEFRFEIRITGARPDNPRVVSMSPRENEQVHHLKDEALQTRTFNVRIEDGSFAEPSIVEPICERTYYWTKLLVFDTSPFGSRSDWKDKFYEYNFWGNPDRPVPWPHKEFVAYSPRLDALEADTGVMGFLSNVCKWLLG